MNNNIQCTIFNQLYEYSYSDCTTVSRPQIKLGLNPNFGINFRLKLESASFKPSIQVLYWFVRSII